MGNTRRWATPWREASPMGLLMPFAARRTPEAGAACDIQPGLDPRAALVILKMEAAIAFAGASVSATTVRRRGVRDPSS